MTKRFLTYHAGEHDPKNTQSADLTFEDGVEVEVPAAREWLWHRLSLNPFFSSRVEEDAPVEEDAQDGEDVHTGPEISVLPSNPSDSVH